MISKNFENQKEAEIFADDLMLILKGELTESKELKEYIEFAKNNPGCELIMRPIEPEGIKIGLAVSQDFGN